MPPLPPESRRAGRSLDTAASPALRPRRVEGARACARIWMWVTTGERAALRRVAQENHQTIAQAVRDAVIEFVAEYDDRTGGAEELGRARGVRRATRVTLRSRVPGDTERSPA